MLLGLWALSRVVGHDGRRRDPDLWFQGDRILRLAWQGRALSLREGCREGWLRCPGLLRSEIIRRVFGWGRRIARPRRRQAGQRIRNADEA